MGEITPAMIKHYWTEMLHAVSVIHKRGIIHKDLKPANFLLVAGTLKLIDFYSQQCAVRQDQCVHRQPDGNLQLHVSRVYPGPEWPSIRHDGEQEALYQDQL